MHLNKNTDDEKSLLKESEETVLFGAEPSVLSPEDEVGVSVQTDPLEDEDWLESGVQLIAFQTAAKAMVAWKFGVPSRIEIDHAPESPSNEMTVVGRFDVVLAFSKRQMAAIGLAGRIAVLMFLSNRNAVDTAVVLDSLEDGAFMDSVREDVEDAFPRLLDNPGFIGFVKEVQDCVQSNWDLVKGLTEHLVRCFHEEGFVVMTEGMLVEIMGELEVDRKDPNA